jgi:hypothetical protein
MAIHDLTRKETGQCTGTAVKPGVSSRAVGRVIARERKAK